MTKAILDAEIRDRMEFLKGVLSGVEMAAMGQDSDNDSTIAVELSNAADGVSQVLALSNGQANAAASTNETIDMMWLFGSSVPKVDAAKISVIKDNDFTTGANEDAAMIFSVAAAGTLTEMLRLDGDDDEVVVNANTLRVESGTVSPAPALELNATGSATSFDIQYQNDGVDSGFIRLADAGIGISANETDIVLNVVGSNLLLITDGADAQDGDGVIAIKDCTTAPTTNPSGGGILYVESGALKYRNGSGATTIVA